MAPKNFKMGNGHLYEPYYYYKQNSAHQMKLYSGTRKIGSNIPDEIACTGNIDRLEVFYRENKSKFNAKEKQYMQSRILTAHNLEKIEKNSLKRIARGEAFPKAEAEFSNGFLGLKNLHTERQTAHNGCWSCAYSLLLKSRGINLSQKEIRNYRAEFDVEGPQHSAEYMERMNSDQANSVYDNSDLLMKVLPNTAMKTVDFNSMETAYLRYAGPNGTALDHAEILACQKAYKKQVSEYISTTVTKAMTEDQAPIIMNLGNNHYVTITGISEDGKTLRFEDSLAKEGESTTKYQTIESIVEQRLLDTPGRDYLKGLSLTWMRDIAAPEYDAQKYNAGEQGFSAREDAPETAVVDRDGNVMLGDAAAADEAQQGQGDAFGEDFLDKKARYGAITAGNGNPGFGQLKGGELTQQVALNQDVLQFQIDKKIENFDRGKFFIATEHEYIPKKVYYKKDPKLVEESLNAEDDFDDLDPIDELEKAPLGKSMTYRQYIERQQQEYHNPGSNKPELIAKVYAANKLMADSRATLDDIADTGVITSLAIIAGPAAKQLNDFDPMAANMVNINNGMDIVTSIDTITKPYSFGKNDPNADARKTAVKTACDALKASGTGKDWFGRTRKANSDKYREMISTANAYNSVLDKGNVPTALMTHMVVSKTLDYISDKYTVRDTTSGAQRFDHAMEILRVTMPEDQYRQLLADINRARKAAPGSKNFIDHDTYRPATWADPQPDQPEAGQAKSEGPAKQLV